MIIILEGRDLQDVILDFISREFPGKPIDLDDEGNPMIFINHAQYDQPRIEVHLKKKDDSRQESDHYLVGFDDDDILY